MSEIKCAKCEGSHGVVQVLDEGKLRLRLFYHVSGADWLCEVCMPPQAQGGNGDGDDGDEGDERKEVDSDGDPAPYHGPPPEGYNVHKSKAKGLGMPNALSDREPTITRDGRQWRVDFNSLTQVVKTALRVGYAVHAPNAHQGEAIEAFYGRANMAKGHKSDPYWGGWTLASLEPALREPPTRSLGLVSEMRVALEATTPAPVRRRIVKRRLMEGDVLDADAWLMREGEGWSEARRDPRQRHVLKVGVNVGLNCGSEPEEALWRGAATMALVDHLIDEGFPVEVTAFFDCANLSDRIDMAHAEVLVKPAHAPLDMASIAMACGEMGFFRLGLMPATCRLVPTTLRWGWGRMSDATPATVKSHDAIVPNSVHDKASATEWLTETMRATGVKLGLVSELEAANG